MGIYRTHIKIITMQSIAQVQNVQKINTVSTGKVANEKSMMVWRPHGNKMFETFSFLPPLSDADLTKQVQYLLNNAGLRASNSRTRPTPTLTATAGLVWTPPSTPTTTTTDTGSCGSCRCTVATTPTKSSKKSRRASRRSRTATSDAPASTTSSKCNVLASCATDRSWTRWKVVPDKSLTDKSKQLSFVF